MRYLPLLLALTLSTPALLADEAPTAPATAAATQKTAIDEAAEEKALAKLIQEVIKHLEAKKYAEAVEVMVSPQGIDKLKRKGEWNRLLERMETEFAPIMLRILKHAQNVKPVFESQGENITATYPQPEYPADRPPGPIRFSRINGQWYAQ